MDDAKYNGEAVETLVAKRLHNLDYIKRTLSGSVHWMNTILLSREDIINYYTREKKDILQKRAEQWFYIGISLSPILTLPPGLPYIAALSTFWEEFEHWSGSAGKKTMGPVTVNVKDMRNARTGTGSGGNEFLNTPNIPSSLDYIEILQTMCDLLEHVYKKFVSPEMNTQMAKGIAKVDTRFKHHIFSCLTKDFNALAMSLTKQQMNALDPIFGVSGWEETDD